MLLDSNIIYSHSKQIYNYNLEYSFIKNLIYKALTNFWSIKKLFKKQKYIIIYIIL